MPYALISIFLVNPKKKDTTKYRLNNLQMESILHYTVLPALTALTELNGVFTFERESDFMNPLSLALDTFCVSHFVTRVLVLSVLVWELHRLWGQSALY